MTAVAGVSHGTNRVTDRFGILAAIGLPPHRLGDDVPLLRSAHRLRVTRMTTTAFSHGMSCDAVRALSFAACDGELREQELVTMNAHLGRCTECRTRLIGDAVFVRALRAAASIDAAPPSLRERVAQLLQQHAAESASR
jgi:hypothetical protein